MSEPAAQGGPYIFVKHRPTQTVLTSQRFGRFWKNKESGQTVMVLQYQNVVGPATIGRRIVFQVDGMQGQFSMEERQFRAAHEAVSTTDKF